MNAQEAGNGVNRVVNEFNQPIQGAVVKAEGGDFTYRTKKDGEFRLPVEADSRYFIISAPGYQNIRLTFEEIIDQVR